MDATQTRTSFNTGYQSIDPLDQIEQNISNMMNDIVREIHENQEPAEEDDHYTMRKPPTLSLVPKPSMIGNNALY